MAGIADRDDPQIGAGERDHRGIVVEQGHDHRPRRGQEQGRADAPGSAKGEGQDDAFAHPLRLASAPVLAGKRRHYRRQGHQRDQGERLDPAGDAEGGHRLRPETGHDAGDDAGGYRQDDVAAGRRQADHQNLPPGVQQRRRGRQPCRQQALAVVQDADRRDQGHRPGDHRGDGRPFDLQARHAEPAEDQDRVEDDVDPGRRHHDVAGKLGVAGRPDDGVADHGHDQEDHAQIPDRHVVVDQRQDRGRCPHGREQRVDRQQAHHHQHRDDDDGEDQGIGGQALDPFPVAGPDRTGHHRCRARAQPQRHRAEDEDHGEGKADRRQRVGAELGDEVGVDEVEADDGQDAPDHRHGHGDQVRANRPDRQAGLRVGRAAAVVNRRRRRHDDRTYRALPSPRAQERPWAGPDRHSVAGRGRARLSRHGKRPTIG